MIKITERYGPYECDFVTLENGDAFRYENSIYLKVSGYQCKNAFSFERAMLVDFKESEKVELIEAELRLLHH